MHFRLPLSGALPTLTIDLRPENDDERQAVRRRLAVDLQLGDPLFDRTFVVEAAPADTVRALLDEPTRDALVALAPLRLALDGGALHITKALRDGPDDHERAVEIMARMVHACGVMGERIPRLTREMARTSEVGGYRGSTPAVERSERERAVAEVAAIETVRVRREQRTQARRIGIGLGVFVVVVAGIVLSMLGR